MTYREIKAAVKSCGIDNNCEECPLKDYKRKGKADCITKMLKEIYELMEEYEDDRK